MSNYRPFSNLITYLGGVKVGISQFNESEWLTLQAAPIWVFEVVAVSDGKIDPEEIIGVVKQVENVVEYSSGGFQRSYCHGSE